MVHRLTARPLLIVLAAILSLALAACGSAAEAPTEAPAPTAMPAATATATPAPAVTAAVTPADPALAGLGCATGRRPRRHLRRRPVATGRPGVRTQLGRHRRRRQPRRQRPPGIPGAPPLDLRIPLLPGIAGQGQTHRPHPADQRRRGIRVPVRLHQPRPAALPVDGALPPPQHRRAHQQPAHHQPDLFPRAGHFPGPTI